MPKRSQIVGLLALLIVIISLGAGVLLVQDKQSIFARAWNGFSTIISSRLTTPDSSLLPSSAASQILFYRLQSLYPDAEKLEINIPSAQIQGEAYLAHDTSESIPKTFVFIRLVNLTPPTGRILGLWLVNSKAKIYIPAAVAESVSTDVDPISYFVSVHDGDLSAYDTLSISFDLSPEVTTPSLSIIDLRL